MARRWKRKEVRFYSPRRHWGWIGLGIVLLTAVWGAQHSIFWGIWTHAQPPDASVSKPPPAVPSSSRSFEEPAASMVPEDLVIPILCFHDVSHSSSRWAVAPEAFENLLKTLTKEGYDFLTVSEAVAVVKGEFSGNIPDRPIALTIDDGFPSAYHTVFPLLQKYQVKATLFVYTEGIKGHPLLSWDDLKEMVKSGLVEIGSHSVSHTYPFPLLKRFGRKAFKVKMEREVFESRKILEERIGEPVSGFAYPGGQVDKTLENLVKEAGYSWAVTINPVPFRLGMNLYRIPRFAVAKGTTLKGINRWLTGESEPQQTAVSPP
ncbi:MAG: polysaccharide deacetylase family protein [Armatimonadetes bacterium]|nr:polysaccharide deacetylase family protein [Armatimonadota bacterium]MDW8121241.1 polysaccharide deacetylase family protein [Armatimonadota bacterium]